MVKTECQQIEHVVKAFDKFCGNLDVRGLASICQDEGVNGHLAVMSRPYLTKLLDGRKRIESRFGLTRSAPFQRITSGDIIFLKRTAGPIVAIAAVGRAEFYGPFQFGDAERLMDEHHEELALEPAFRECKHASRYATLIYFTSVVRIKPRSIAKLDRRSWIVLQADMQLPLV